MEGILREEEEEEEEEEEVRCLSLNNVRIRKVQ
jgi:hypothetical protein